MRLDVKSMIQNRTYSSVKYTLRTRCCGRRWTKRDGVVADQKPHAARVAHPLGCVGSDSANSFDAYL